MALVLGCASDVPPAPAISVRDSAGVRIVASRAPAWPDTAPGWRLSSAPLLDIGQPDRDGVALSQVSDATRLSDGRVVVANGGSRRLEFFSADGRHLAAAGRPGSGPGEFNSPLILVETTADDFVVAATPGDGRRYVFAPSTRLARIVDLSASSLPSVGEHSVITQLWLPEGPPVLMETVHHAVTTPGLAGRDTVMFRGTGGKEIRLPGREWVVDHLGHARQANPPSHALVVAARDKVYFSHSADPEVRVFAAERSVDGGARPLRLVSIFRRAWTPVAVTDSVVDQARMDWASFWGGVPEPVPARLRQFDDRPVASHLPAHGDFIVDAEGNVWLPRYSLEFAAPFWPPDVTTTWDVYGADGAWLGGVPMPPRFWPFEIGTDWVLGLWRDGYDAERVQLFHLDKVQQQE